MLQIKLMFFKIKVFFYIIGLIISVICELLLHCIHNILFREVIINANIF